MRSTRFVITAAAAVACLASATLAQAQRAVVEGMNQRLTVACGSEGAHVQGSGNTVTLTGACTSVLVEGQNNTVHIATLGSLKVAGMSNKVYWSNGIDGATPKIAKEGFGNTAERKTPADSPAAAPTASTAPKPAAGGTASATASTPSSGATATASPGAPSMTVSKGGKTVGAGATSGGASMSAKRGDPAPARPAASSSGSSASGASSAGRGSPLVFATNQQVKTLECEGRAVVVGGNANRLTLKGQCGPISVGGNENILTVGSTTRIDTSGNRNVVTYRDLVADKVPTVTSGGTGNRVSKADPQ